MTRGLTPIAKTIGYADFSWNVLTGCRHGCAWCYARPIAERLQRQATLGDDCTQPGGGLHEIRYPHGSGADSYRYGFEPTFHSHRLRAPAQRRKPAVIFVSDMGDALGAWWPAAWIAQTLGVIRACPQHQFLLLTKHPIRYAEFELPPNAWPGVTLTGAEDEDKEGRLSYFLGATEGAHRRRWVSYEPILGPLPPATTAFVSWVVMGPLNGPRRTPYITSITGRLLWDAINACRFDNVPVWLKDECRPFLGGLGGLRQEHPEGLARLRETRKEATMSG